MTDGAPEPVQMQAAVQPFGCLIGLDVKTQKILYASENCGHIIGRTSRDLLGAELQVCFDATFVHALANAQAKPRFAETSTSVGSFELGGSITDVSAFAADDVTVVQFEPGRDAGYFEGQELTVLTFLMQKIQTCYDLASLLKTTTNLLQQVTGYDRVMISEFVKPGVLRVTEESCHRSMDPLRGVEFRHWQKPDPARDGIAETLVQIVQNLDHGLVPVLAAHPSLPLLDISLAECQARQHAADLDFLRRLGVKSATTMTIIADGAAWGTISFHHRHERVPAPKMRGILCMFLGFLSERLAALQKQNLIDGIQKVDRIMDLVLSDNADDTSMEMMMSRCAPLMQEVIKADGIALLVGSQIFRSGSVPEQAVLTHMMKEVLGDRKHRFDTDTLADEVPAFKSALNGCAGALMSLIAPNCVFCAFRRQKRRSVYATARTDTKDDSVPGDTPLARDAAFPDYLNQVLGVSEPWTKEDTYFFDRICVLMNNAERRVAKKTPNS